MKIELFPMYIFPYIVWCKCYYNLGYFCFIYYCIIYDFITYFPNNFSKHFVLFVIIIFIIFFISYLYLETILLISFSFVFFFQNRHLNLLGLFKPFEVRCFFQRNPLFFFVQFHSAAVSAAAFNKYISIKKKNYDVFSVF